MPSPHLVVGLIVIKQLVTW